MKKLSLAICALFLLVICGCGNTGQPSLPSDDEESLRISATFMDMANQYFATFADGLADACAQKGYELTVCDGAGNAESQVAAVGAMIEKGCDILCLGPVDQDSMSAAVEAAHEKGIKIIGCHQPVPGCDAYYIPDEYSYGWDAGMLCAEWVNQKLGGQARVALIVDVSMEALTDRSKGCQDALRKLAPGAEIVSVQGGSLSARTAAAAAQAIFTAYPDIQAIATINDVAGVAVAEAAADHAEQLPEDFFICGLDATGEALAEMQKENSFYRATVSIAPYECGRRLAEMCGKLFRGDSLDKTEYFEQLPVTQQGFSVTGGISVEEYLKENDNSGL